MRQGGGGEGIGADSPEVPAAPRGTVWARLARRRWKKIGFSRGMVWEKVPVGLPRDGNGTGRYEAIWLTGRDGNTRYIGGAGRGGIGERVGESVGNMVGTIVGKMVGDVVGKRSGAWRGKIVGNMVGKRPRT